MVRKGLRDIVVKERISQFTAENCGNIPSSKKIADFLKSQKIKGSEDTVPSYLNIRLKYKICIQEIGISSNYYVLNDIPTVFICLSGYQRSY